MGTRPRNIARAREHEVVLPGARSERHEWSDRGEKVVDSSSIASAPRRFCTARCRSGLVRRETWVEGLQSDEMKTFLLRNAMAIEASSISGHVWPRTGRRICQAHLA